MQQLRSLTERYLGDPVSTPEYKAAKEAAERKLAGIIERFGDENGARREPWYLAQLIAEAVKSNRLTRFTCELAELDRFIEEQIGIKKNSPHIRCADRSPAIPIV